LAAAFAGWFFGFSTAGGGGVGVFFATANLLFQRPVTLHRPATYALAGII